MSKKDVSQKRRSNYRVAKKKGSRFLLTCWMRRESFCRLYLWKSFRRETLRVHRGTGPGFAPLFPNHSLARVVHRVRIVFIQDRQQTKGNLRKEEKKRGKKKSLTSRQANDLVVLVKSTSAGERANIASLASQVHHLHAYFKNAAKGGFRD
jgi:hypothetical protein